jgi:8-oxo-dGTP diphosphatase
MSAMQAIKFQPQVGVGLVVMRKKDGKSQILLHRRKKVTTGSGYWGSGGGYLDYVESLLEGAVREFQEESGGLVKIKNTRFLGVCNFRDFEPYHSVDISFIADWVSGKPQDDKDNEAVEWQWFDMDNLPSPLFPVVDYHLKAYKTGSHFTDS